VEFDAESLRPTYRLHIGLPGSSNAFAIASRLGLDNGVLARAESHLSELHRSLERTLREAERHRTDLSAALEEARVSAEDARRHTEEARREAERIRDEAERSARRSRTEADDLLLQSRRALRQAESARDQAAKRNLVDDARAALAEAETTRQSAAAPEHAPRATVPIAVGSPVHVEGVSEPGTLLSIDDRGMADVAAGPLRLRVPATSLRPAQAAQEPPLATRPIIGGSAPAVSLQLDLRGARAEEALAVLDRYLNDAAVAGVDRLRIVHGKGTGALRTAVREVLSRHPLVRAHEPAGAAEGGDGATIVRL
jgi:DNA mismatch repair protein MutS2